MTSSIAHRVPAARRIAGLAAAAAIAAGALVAGPAAAAGPEGGLHPNGISVHPSFAYGGKATGDAHFDCQDRPLGGANLRCYTPAQIRTAYDFDPLYAKGITGAGRTIVIVDAYQNPDEAEDLAIFDATFGLPDPDFVQYAPQGLTPFDVNSDEQINWSGEIVLDVQWAHAVAPGAKIVLVLAKSNDDIDIYNATKWAVDHNVGDVISQSFGEAESCFDPELDKKQHALFEVATSKGITLVASSGDDGAAQPTCDGEDLILSASAPADDPLVTAVGGTTLKASSGTGAYVSERAWAEDISGCPPPDQGCSGGGFSDRYSRPSYQIDTPHTRAGQRGVPDVAYDAGIDGGVLTHWGVGLEAFLGLPPTTPAFFIFGGTSAGSPQWAGLVALADQANHGRVGTINPEIYAIAHLPSVYGKAFNDVVDGSNSLDSVSGYRAATNWDPVTGLGTPDAAKLVPLLAAVN